MKTITEKVSGILRVSEDTIFLHVLASEVTVEKNVIARLYGIVTDKILVEENAIVYLHGRCDGHIISNKGIVYQFLPSGMVNCLEPRLEKK